MRVRLVGRHALSRREPIRNALSVRRDDLVRVRDQLDGARKRQALTQPLSRIYESVVHMHCNRLGHNPIVERRLLGLLLRAREAIAHRPEIISKRHGASLS